MARSTLDTYDTHDDHDDPNADPEIGEQPRLRRWIALTLVSLMLFGGLHHLDHVLRGNHTGLPVIADINPFTYSLLVYPLAALWMAVLVALVASAAALVVVSIRVRRMQGHW